MGMVGVSRDYDIFFTENGMAFVNTVSSLKGHLIGAASAPFGVVGALSRSAAMDHAREKGRTELQNVNLKEILERARTASLCPTMR